MPTHIAGCRHTSRAVGPVERSRCEDGRSSRRGRALCGAWSFEPAPGPQLHQSKHWQPAHFATDAAAISAFRDAPVNPIQPRGQQSAVGTLRGIGGRFGWRASAARSSGRSNDLLNGQQIGGTGRQLIGSRHHETEAETARAVYPSDWRDFAAWCASRGAHRPAGPRGIVAAYLSWLADSGRKSSTIGRRAAASATHHTMAGHEPPTNQGVRAVLRGIRRTHRHRQGGEGVRHAVAAYARSPR